MGLKDFLSFFLCESKNCDVYKEQLLNAQNALALKQVELNNLMLALDAQSKVNDDLNQQIEIIAKSVPDSKPFYYSAVKSITHSWRAPNNKSVQIPVQDFVQNSLVELAVIARKKNLYLFDGKDIKFDYKVVSAYKSALLLNYRLDSTQFNETERWLTPLEALGTGFSDCEESASLIVSLLEHIGVPKDRVEIVIGKANNGIGHATVRVKDSEGIWRHINSTAPFEKFTDLTDFPVFGVNDKDFVSNGFNLKAVDYGFNSVYAFSNLDRPENLESFIIRNSSLKPDSLQINDFTVLQNKIVERGSGLPVPKAVVEFSAEGESKIVFVANNAGVLSVNVPDRFVGKKVTLNYFKEGFKGNSFDVSFEEGKSTSFLVQLIRGA